MAALVATRNRRIQEAVAKTQGNAMKQIDLREGARRQHRTIALFAVVQCWTKNLDGIALERHHLERLLGLERFKGTRVVWLQEDLRELFPHQAVFWLHGKRGSLGSIFVSRAPLDTLPRDTMTTATRVARLTATGGPRIARFELWAEPSRNLNDAFEGLLPFFAQRANFDERFLSSYLALLAQGQISPHTLPPMKSAT
jgi:hypothetical protein